MTRGTPPLRTGRITTGPPRPGAGTVPSTFRQRHRSQSLRVAITGGGSGIGLAAARRFVHDGHEVTIVGRRAEVLESAATDLGPACSFVVADASSPADATRIARTLSGGLDVLVCAAGGVAQVDGDDLDAIASRWSESFKLNVLSAVVTTSALLPHIARPGGRIVAISSVSGRKGAGSYGAAKAALNSWVNDLAGDLAAEGITVNAVAPGYIPDTGYWDGRRDEAEVQRRLAKVAAGRPGTPAEVAEAIAYFASPAAGFTTGQILGVDGGTLLAL